MKTHEGTMRIKYPNDNYATSPIAIGCECATYLAVIINDIKEDLLADGALHVSIKVRERI